MSKVRSGASAATPSAASRPRIEVILKWIAAVTAVLSLIVGSFQVTRLLSDVRERKRFIAESLDVAHRQQAGGDYASAWSTLEGGVKSADEGGQFAKLFGQLSEERQQLRTAQEDLAMQWLRNLHVGNGKRFSDYVDRLLPVLDRGAATTSGAARADRIAHIGWAYFLKLRDGPGSLEPASQYRMALQADADNPYAHAYWGHWMLWQREPLADALAHFDAAAKNAATRPYVRSIELAALRSRTDGPGSAQLLRVVDQMRRNGEPVRAGTVNDVYGIYNSMVLSGEVDRDLLAALPASDHIALIDALLTGPAVEPWRTNVAKAAQALFHEQAGDDGAALAQWRAVRAALSANEISLRSRADAAIRRLQSKQAGKAR